MCCFCYQYHETINEALEAVPYDGVVIVHAGVYDEQLSISKPVSIIGAGTDHFINIHSYNDAWILCSVGCKLCNF